MKKEDRRKRMTRQAIRESLIERMQELPLAKISVKMICETADINRSTFYAHYKDPYDLLGAVQGDVIKEVKEKAFSAQFFNASDGGRSALEQLLEYGRENASLLKVLLNENENSPFYSELMQLAQEKMVEEMRGKKNLSDEDMQYLENYVLAGFLGVVRHWLNRECVDAPKDMAKLMMDLMVCGISGL